jgi:hypothetical protein
MFHSALRMDGLLRTYLATASRKTAVELVRAARVRARNARASDFGERMVNVFVILGR